jgi:CubicO group peptidase (beta-lactamase class C family)
VGEVHDLNAAVLGGIAPHAGLFGSADTVAQLGLTYLGAQRSGGWVSSATVDTFFSHRGPGSHHLGFDGVTPGASSAGPDWPLDGVGHLGFTGCSLWLAPQQGVSVALLANRVHPVIEGGAVPGSPLHPRYRRFKALRPAVHSAVVSVLSSAGHWSASHPAHR